MTSSSHEHQGSPRPTGILWLLSRLPDWLGVLFGGLGRSLLMVLVFLVLVLSVPLIIAPLTIWQQTIVAILLMLIGWFMVRLEQRQTQQQTSEYLHLFLVWLSIVTTFRYLYYRTSYTLNLDSWVNGTLSILLFGAELYAIATLLLAYFQTLKLKDRQPVDLSAYPKDQWFSVDIYIPTYNEDVEIVRKTALAAMAIDYPPEKKRVYVLDDGRKFPERREQLRQICNELGCMMLIRDNNDHAKAGNINTAMQHTTGELVLILDCDHIPTRQFLLHTVGFFYDAKVALVQTPHWFYNPDPFERNLLTQGRVPVNNELFYKVLQKGNDFWNAAFFCGSAAVFRKDYVQEVGGIAVETVTEDCHTSLRLHSKGYKSVYYDKIMVAGLAPERFSAYVGQQVRWARGMAQILRLENPLFNPKLKLSLAQRLCYFSATSHFFFGFPRLMYAIAPILYLLLGVDLIRGLGTETLAYALPHIVLAMNANYITYKTVRFSFWNEIFEYAMAFQDGLVTFMALLNPKLGKFNVTAKGTMVNKRSFDWSSAQVPVIVSILLLVSLMTVPFWLILRPENQEAVIINAAWSVFNLLLLIAAILVAFEQPQLRRAHRLDRQLTAIIYSQDQTWTGKTLDASETGCRILLENWPNLPDQIELELVGDFGARAFLNGQIIRVTPQNDNQIIVAVDFVNPTPIQFDALVLVLYSDVNQWYSQERQNLDNPLGSLRFLITGLFRVFQDPKPDPRVTVRKQVSAAVQIYWEGQFHPATATEINTRTLRLELTEKTIHNLDEMRHNKPAIGLLVSQYSTDPLPKRLIAQVETIELPGRMVDTPYSAASTTSPTVIELRFPKNLDRQQGIKIKQLLKTLR
ncbi:UDP-forming cellulose synthase catalytic subunit [Leptolyngbya sp. FACHB-671]|uniref:UDP-forming cellulose synthase catalytic subunit n=1 Tax=unclassified Leptolyngbya TaxID=2650499 RepID=UPI0016824E0A|nr:MULTISPECIES: UDP-forming cellulose synthase catalytic subunit [unclassified Leptolyngbya]MBD2000409.1 UDP-forming cellulose synthase catalytic subunit [Leptolyngbya sp. FACHB-541]MBD2069463.1 UDP-forming cellulose synthase catalytic subunit [Leptolyngbya sp. FACHB-671]